MLIGNAQEFKVRQFRRSLRQAHIGPDDAAALHARITGVLHFFHELLLGRYIGHRDALAVWGVLPSVIGAAQPVLFHVPEVKGSKPVRAVSPNEPDLSSLGAEQNQIFAKEFDSHRPAAGLSQM